MDDVTSGSVRYAFGPFSFSRNTLTLTKDGEPLRLERKLREGLLFFLERAGETVARDEILEGIWQTQHRTDQSVTTLVGKLREILGQDAIETVYGFGYRLTLPVTIHTETRSSPQLGLQPGDRLKGRAHWVLVEPVAGGKHPDVWLAEHQKTRERRVFKFAADADGLRHLKREVTLSRMIATRPALLDGFARVLDWQFEEPPFFIEMPYIGPDLSRWAAAGGLDSLDRAQRLALFAQLAKRIGGAHAIGVIHKDLKPANLLVRDTPAGPELVVGDFGSGKLLDGAGLEALGITRIGFTQTGDTSSLSGTPLYMAPELLSGEAPTTQADVYSMGVILYQLIIGDLRRPMAEGWQERIDDPLLREDIAAAVQEDPRRRIASAIELAERLRSLEERRSERAHAEEQARFAETMRNRLELQRVRRPWQWAAVAALTLGLAGSIAFAVRSEGQRRDAEIARSQAEALSDVLTQDLLAAIDPYADAAQGAVLAELFQKARPAIEERLAGNPTLLGRVLFEIGRIHMRLGRLTDVPTYMKRAAELPSYSVVDASTRTAGYLTIASLVGDPQVLPFAGMIEARLQTSPEIDPESEIINALALHWLLWGEYQKALNFSRTFFEMPSPELLGEDPGFMAAQANWALAAARVPDLPEAKRAIAPLLEAMESGLIDNPFAVTNVNNIAARIAIAEGDQPTARMRLAAAKLAAQDLPEDHSFRGSVLELSSMIDFENEAFSDALPLMQQAVAIEAKSFLPTSLRRIEAVIQLAEIQNRLGDGTSAEATIMSILGAVKSAQPEHPIASLLHVHHAHAALVRGKVELARERLDAVKLVEEDDSAHAHLLRARAQWIEALVLRAENDIEGAASTAERALQTTRSLSGLHQVYVNDLEDIVRPPSSSG